MSETATEGQVGTSPPASPSAAVAAPKPKAKAKPTEYHILKLDLASAGANEKWTVHARNVEAQGAQAAIRKAVTETDQSQTFVAVPSRSFHPITVTVETKTQLVLS
jgi:hypothetical protein